MSAPVSAEACAAGFAHPPEEAACAFRAAMTAMARPGNVQEIGAALRAPAGISQAAAALLLTLTGPETGVCLAPGVESAGLRAWLAFHTGAPVVAAPEAGFALGTWDALLPLTQYRAGTPEYPDRSATLIVETAGFAPANARLRGPGIKDSIRMALPGIAALQENARGYPLGLDFFFTCGAEVAALPRSAQITAED
ncbi:phosphonate C-P lyase system protein PhnH [Cribrihabitans neustonicus]|uniref:phosphonate C-P lyase system protein PhnH n=1 Tax=Cribrihabitans neustonicus TaxID=1429085 RepID=UPI003B5B1E3C